MTKSSDHWMPLDVGDYLRDTTRLSTQHHGAYLLLILDYWVNGTPPDDDETLARIVRMQLKDWVKIRPVIAAFFTIEDGHWHHGRVERELEKSRQFIAKQRANGALGGRPKRNPEETQRLTQTKAKPKPNKSLLQPQPHRDSTQPLVSETAPEPNGRLVEDLLVVAGIASRAPSLVSAAESQVSAWQRDGIDIEAVVKPVIRQVIGASDEPSHSLRRFDKAVRHEHAKRGASNGPPVDESKWTPERRAEYARRVSGEAVSIGSIVGDIAPPHAAAGGRG